MRLLLLAPVLLATPAAAQFAPHPRSAVPATARPSWGGLGDAYARIDRGRDSGQLSKREAKRLRGQASYIGTLSDRYGQDGLSDAEARELETRSLVLRDEVDARRLGAKPGQAVDTPK